MSDFRKHLSSALEDPEFKIEWEAQSTERTIAKRIVEARLATGMTQAELALACDMKPANLCRLENGNGNPSVATLEKIAKGLGRRLEISFV